MATLNTKKLKNGTISAFTTNINLRNKWLYAFDRGVQKFDATKDGVTWYGITISLPKVVMKDKEALTEYIFPIIGLADEYEDPFPQQELSFLGNALNYIRSYNSTVQSFRGHISDKMKELVDKGDVKREDAVNLINGYTKGGGQVFGLKFSPANAEFILYQDPEATFVATEQQWEKYFNRFVDASKNPIPVYVKTNLDQGVDTNALRARFGLSNTDSLTAHQKASAHKNDSNATKGKSSKLSYEIAYDVRFTTVIEGKEDLYTKEAGLESNIYGNENKMAKSLKTPKTSKKGYTNDDYTMIDVSNIKDIREQSKQMIINANVFLANNNFQELSNASNFKQALDNVLEYQLKRVQHDIKEPPQVIKNVALAYLMTYFNVWQDNKTEFPSIKDVSFDNKQDYKHTYFIIMQTSQILLGRNFGLKGVTRESVEDNVAKPIKNIPLPTFDDFLNFMGTDKEELAQMPNQQQPKLKSTIGNTEEPNDETPNPMQNQQIKTNEELSKELNLIKENFNKMFNRITNLYK